MAIGLGSMDMPVPSVAEWEWLNWRFPRPVHAGDTIFARWTLTQKRPPGQQAQSSIVVWRVDVVKTDGTLCAEGEVGAKVKRQAHSADRGASREGDAGPATATPGRSRRRRRRTNGHGADNATAAPTARTAQTPKAATQPTAGASKPRRRRRRSSSPNTAREGETAATAAPAAAAPAAQPTDSVSEPKPELAAAPASAVAAAKSSEKGGGSTLGRVIGRLRRP